MTTKIIRTCDLCDKELNNEWSGIAGATQHIGDKEQFVLGISFVASSNNHNLGVMAHKDCIVQARYR